MVYCVLWLCLMSADRPKTVCRQCPEYKAPDTGNSGNGECVMSCPSKETVAVKDNKNMMMPNYLGQGHIC